MNVDTIINGVLDREGGTYTDDPKDPGGPTKWGITQATLSAWLKRQATEWDVMNLTRADAFAIYNARYYLGPGFGQIAGLSASIADELTDTGVNCGTAVAITLLQRCLNAFNNAGAHYHDIDVDGAMGPATLRALSEYLARRGSEGEAVLLRALNCLQGERYIELAEKSARFESFVYGWIKNRVAI